jgi:dTDP-4-amino-4,6-dideoxygalactose transaminase
MFFNIPYTCSESYENVKSLIQFPESVNDAQFLQKCILWFKETYPGYTPFMTTSCTRAMELISLSLDFKKGDEIILSPYNYVGVGNAFSNYGATLVYVDIDKDTMNIDPSLIESAITDKTKAIVAMHYAAVPCDMDRIKSLCERYNLILIEDNAQGIQSYYKDRLLGSMGDFSCLSFDMLKNISCNEGGVLLVKDKWAPQVNVAYFNGTNKTAFQNKLVSKYEWVAKGSKFLMSEYAAAVLHPLLENSVSIISQRKKIWRSLFEKLSENNILKEFVPAKLMSTDHNGHLAYLKFNSHQRNSILNFLNKNGVPSSFHYVPLDTSVEGKRISPATEVCPVSLSESERLIRLPMHNFLKEEEQEAIVNTLLSALNI